MIKTPFLALLFTFPCVTGIHAQQPPSSLEQLASDGITGDEFIVAPAVYPQPLSYYSKSINETVIGETVYDHQSGRAVQSRVIDYGDGTHGAAFIYGYSSPGFADRGAGYNFSPSPTVWSPIPTTRIETIKAGSPNLMYTAGGTEAVICHTAGTGELRINRRSTRGTGAWTESVIPSNTGRSRIYPKAVTGGPNGNSIHCIAITQPLSNGGSTYQGIDGALLYYRSTDEGATWDVIDYLDQNLDATKFVYTRYDSYAIASRGNTVAIAVFNQMADVIILKSTDNGLTWNSQIVNDFPVDLYQVDTGIDLNNDQIADILETSDETGAIVIDHSGMVHITFGKMLARDANLNDNQWTFFPLTGELLYWNESMGTGNFVSIATPEDINNNGFIDDIGDIGRYSTGACSQSALGINADGTLFVTYSAIREDRFTTTQNYRHIYAMKSNDGGNSWTTPVNLTPDIQQVGYEAVYPCMNPNVTDRVRITYMRDLEPGIAVWEEMDPFTINQIMYLEVDTVLASQAGINESVLLEDQVQLFPNPSAGNIVELKLQTTSSSAIHIQLLDLNGRKISTIHEGNLEQGIHSFSIETNGLTPGTYLVKIVTNEGTLSKELLITK